MFRSFEAVVRFFDARLSYVPLELVLGFFCTQVFNRWNKQYDSIGFIDKCVRFMDTFLEEMSCSNEN